MQFPKRILKLFTKIALDQIMAPERTDQLFEEVQILMGEINDWRLSGKQLHSASGDQAVQDTGPAIPPSRQEDVTDLSRKLQARFTDEATTSLTPDQAVTIVKSEIPGRSGTYVLWVSNDVLPSLNGTGRYVHFSWDTGANGRVGFKVSDFASGRLFHEPGTAVDDQGWSEVITTPKSAAEIWATSPSRIRTVQANGLGIALGSVKELATRHGWKQALADLPSRYPAAH